MDIKEKFLNFALEEHIKEVDVSIQNCLNSINLIGENLKEIDTTNYKADSITQISKDLISLNTELSALYSAKATWWLVKLSQDKAKEYEAKTKQGVK